MTSSLRNSVHRRNHKERSQLAYRSKLGLLEKHADYVKRARDYHSKQDRLTRLKQKASERNKDEFYFSMTKEKTKDGVHIQDRGNVALPTDMVKVLKSQDENYIRTMRASGIKKIDKIKNQLMEMADLLKTNTDDFENDDSDAELDEGEIEVLRKAKIIPETSGSHGTKRKHILFAENTDEASRLSKKGKSKQTDKDVASSPKDDSPFEIDLGWKSAEPKKKSRRKSVDAKDVETSIEAEENRKRDLAHRTKLIKELSARLDRDKQLRYTEREFEMQRLLMGKSGKKKIHGVEKVEGDEDDEDREETQNEIDARRGRKQKATHKIIDETTYRPRVYKWRLERKR
ncbi:small-subunit processome [Pholiota conissans]|uniref:Small-subunit processome n=1 Tax=Pholiota conissans TaxID=109636 RepID=A0A9P5Z926_9AGAR|nr:small-subunit processome [Pholiota conissans]